MPKLAISSSANQLAVRQLSKTSRFNFPLAWLRQQLCWCAWMLPVLIGLHQRVQAQVVPAHDGTGTVVTLKGNQFNITGGQLSKDQANLFHSFSTFGLSPQQIANFLSTPQVQNILARVVGGNPSIIHGLIQVSGSHANLFLLNPTGIIFGPAARLNVPAAFTATTANAIQFGSNWYSATGVNNYGALAGNPQAFAFTMMQPGAIVNAAPLAVGSGQDLTLLGGTVVSTGSLFAPGGNLIVAAVPGENLVRLSEPGNPLSLEFQPLSSPSTLPPSGKLPVSTLPELLTGGGDSATRLIVNQDGTVTLTGAGLAVAPQDVVVRNATAETAILSARHNLTLFNSRINTTGDINLIAQNQVYLHDSATEPLTAIAGGQMEIQGNQGIDIFALHHPLSGLFAGGDLVLRSAGRVSGDANFTTGGSFRIEQLNSTPGSWHSLAQAGIRATQDVNFYSYSGPSLQILAGNGVTVPGNITITGTNTLANSPAKNVTLSNGSTVHIDGRTQPTLDIEAGTTAAGPPGISHTTTGADISIGRITNKGGLVFLSNQVSPNFFLPGGEIKITGNGTAIDPSNTAATGGSIIIDSRSGIQIPGSLNSSGSIGNGSGNVTLIAHNAITTGTGIITRSNGGNGGQGITTGSISTNGGNINLISSNGAINSGSLNSSSVNGNGGKITVAAAQNIKTGAINSSSATNNGGSVTLSSTGNGELGNIQVASINASGGSSGIGGNVSVSTHQFFSVTNTFNDFNGIDASISTTGGISGGLITINHGGGLYNTPFVVGDPTINGTAGAITRGKISTASTILPKQSFFGSHSQDNNQIQILTQTESPTSNNQAPPPTQPTTQPTETVISVITPIEQSNNITVSNVLPDAVTIPQVDQLNRATASNAQVDASIQPVEAINSGTASNNQTETVTVAPVTIQSSEGLSSSVTTSDDKFSGEFESYLGLPSQHHVTLNAERTVLSKIERTAGIKSAVIYVSFVPPGAGEVSFQTQDDHDQLELLVVTAKGNPIRRRFSTVTRAKVLKVAKQFREALNDPLDADTNNTDYLVPSQQLYKWIVAPIEKDLQARGISNLLFITDIGLRSTPIAALNDGQKFLVEKYSVGLTPSFSLTDTSYVDLRNPQVLAMGASQFQQYDALPAVPEELSLVAKQLLPGKIFLNQGFTLNNLKLQHQSQKFSIIHLATHSEFVPGTPSDSFIQLWDSKLLLPQLRELKLNHPPVDLLVLSACQTALGNEQAELGFGGLAAESGVKTALASLWYISDEGTLGLMSEFYQHLKTVPIKAEALRQAQIAMLKGRVQIENGQLRTSFGLIPLPPELAKVQNRTLSHPYYWSAFTMIGSPW